MKLYEKNLKKIIKFIEEYGAIEEVNIKNSTMIIAIAGEESSQVNEMDLNRPKKYTITFTMGDIKRNLP